MGTFGCYAGKTGVRKEQKEIFWLINISVRVIMSSWISKESSKYMQQLE